MTMQTPASINDSVDEPRKRHRWKATHDHFYPGPKYWECIQCGLQKITEWEEKPRYSMRDGRTWYRFAPPCPPLSKGAKP
jgi:hypothetical protein